MSSLVLCRACLSFNVRMYPIATTRYREMYQKHTGAKFITGEGRPDTVCYLCNAQLLRFCRFIQMTQKSEKYLSQLHRDGVELTADNVRSFHNFSITSMQRSSITDHAEDLPDLELVSVQEHRKNVQIEDVDVKIESLDEEFRLFYDDTEESNNSEISSNDDVVRTPVYEILESDDEIEIEVQPPILIQPEDAQTNKPDIQLTSPVHDNLEPETSEITEYTNKPDQYMLPKVSVVLERIPISTRSHIKKTKQSYNTDRFYHCKKCNYKCFYKDVLKKHLKMHDQKRAHTCTLCSHRFRTANGLDNHTLKVHDKQDKCRICAKPFKKPLYLQRHMRLHMGTQPYICEFCDRKFNHRSTYLVHCRTHTGEKPFACKWCNKAFNDQSNCRKHMKMHTGELFACYLCDKTYSLKSHLKQHVVEHIL